MNHKERHGARLDDKPRLSGEKYRSLTNTSLISVCVAAYAGVLIAFRVTKAVERFLASVLESADGKRISATRNRADLSASRDWRGRTDMVRE